MSAFSPLNLVEDVSASKKDLEEEHTRELEIESAFKTYQEAIALQSKKQWAAAYKKYKELANSTVVTNHFYEEVSFIKGLQNGGSNLQPDELSFIPQNVKKIRFLYFRNRGFLHFNILKEQPETFAEILKIEQEIEPALDLFEFRKDLFYTMLDGFVNCLVYEEADESLLHILFDIYTYLDMRRLSRFTLEYCISYTNESDEPLSISCMNDWAIQIWSRFQKVGLYSPEISSDLEQKLSFLLLLKQDFLAQMMEKLQFNSVLVQLKPNTSWLGVINAINTIIRENQDKERLQDLQKIAYKHLDPYIVSETILDNITFEFLSEDTGEEYKVEDQANVLAMEIEAEEDIKVETGNGSELSSLIPERQDTVGASERASMRLSKRLNPGDLAPVDADDILLIRQYFVETELFFSNVNDKFKVIFGEDQPILNDMVGHIVNAEISNSQSNYIYDYLKILNEWKPLKYDPILFPESDNDSKRKSHSDKKRLIDVLTSFGNQFGDSKNHSTNFNDLQGPEFVKDFIVNEFSGHHHINAVKLRILLHLMSFITDLSWGEQLYYVTSEWVMQIEPSVFEVSARHIRETGELKDIKLAMGIYEILINAYIETKERLEQNLETEAHTSFVKSVKSNFNNTTIELLRLKDRIDKWKGLFNQVFANKNVENNDIAIFIRFYWASNYFLAARSFLWKEKKFVVVHLNQLADHLQSKFVGSVAQITYPNYSKIGEFSYEGLHRRLSTASILSIFSKILDQSDSETITTNETISLLESILFNDEDKESIPSRNDDTKGSLLVESVIHGLAVLDKVSLYSVKEFFSECPVDLKLSLWNIVLLYYQKDTFHNFQKGLENYLQFTLDFLSSSSYTEFLEDKYSVLLSLVACYRSHLRTFLNYLSDNKWQLPSRQRAKRQMLNVSRIFELCYIFSLHEEGAFYTSRKVSVETKSEEAFRYFKDFFIDCITMLLIYCFNHISEKKAANDSLISDFLILIHHQLGLRHLCDSSKGLFLKFAEDSLVNLSQLPEKELIQIMSCRYHYKVKLYGQFPSDHYTEKSAELNKKSAEELAIFILPLCFRTNPLTQTPRNDLKQVVDDLFEIIGDPDVENDRALCENISFVEKFIDRSLIGARFIKESFYGLKSLEMFPPQYDNRVAQEGLYFIEAVLMFNSYKIRKKSAQSRTVELERIITILTYDLIYGSNRVESWILLAQAYGFIVEDDLIWTSDKISTIERKVPTANIQRKSLICYLMAINTVTRQTQIDTRTIKPVMNMLMNNFAKELYSASRSPMDMLAFQVHSNPKFVRQNQNALFLKVADKPSVSQKYCLVLMNRCLNIAVKSDPDDWNSLYYSAKVKSKLGFDSAIVLNTLIKASTAAKLQSVSGDPILEPVYKFLSLLYKYAKSQKLSIEDGIKFLNMNAILKTTDAYEGNTKSELYKCIISGFKKILSLDKKAWYHKPAYRQARIMFSEFNDVIGSKELLSKFFTLKSVNKTFLVMWKPEFERPGKHFVYMYQYTKFFITLLGYDQDLSSLVLMYPKLRRANSTMILLVSVWGQLCTLICTIMRKVLDVDAGQEKYFLYTTTYSTFMARAQKVIEVVQADEAQGLLQKNLLLLHILTDMRRLNNGFGPTALIDNIFSGVFIEIFREVSQKHNEIGEITIPDSPTAKVKRLAKKDLFPFAIELASKCKRETELFLRTNPEILNHYVTEYEKLAEIARQKIAAEEEKNRLLARELEIKREAAERERKRMALEQERQKVNPQTRLLRLFAEQLLLRGQKKSMYKMLAATTPMSWHSRIVALDGVSVALPPTKSIEICGPEFLAANFFNESRRFARINETLVPARLPFDERAHPTSNILNVNDGSTVENSGELDCAERKEKIEEQKREESPEFVSIPAIENQTNDEKLTDSTIEPTTMRPTCKIPASINKNILASESRSNRRDPKYQQMALQGTKLDPVDIDCEDGVETISGAKRPLVSLAEFEELPSKRQNN